MLNINTATVDVTNPLFNAIKDLNEALRQIAFKPPITHVYNPLVYAQMPHLAYLSKYAQPCKKVIFLGMNPGPWGMAQTGVPFGEIPAVRDWIGITGPIIKPELEHPKRPIEGFECKRSEVSGRRLWGLFKERFGGAELFFENHFVANYCPLVFMEASGKNFTPDKLPSASKATLYAACDNALRTFVDYLKPRWVIGVGGFAYERAQEALLGIDVSIGKILHPSPASPAANKNWAGCATLQLQNLGVWN